MIIIDIPSVLVVLAVVLEPEKETLLLVIVYRILVPLGTFIDDFIYWSMNCHHSTGFLFFENVTKFDPVILNFNLSQRIFTIFNSYTSCTWDFKLQYCFLSTITLQWSLYSFFPNLSLYVHQIQLSTIWLSILIAKLKNTCPDILILNFDETLSKDLWWKHSPNKAIISF